MYDSLENVSAGLENVSAALENVRATLENVGELEHSRKGREHVLRGYEHATKIVAYARRTLDATKGQTRCEEIDPEEGVTVVRHEEEKILADQMAGKSVVQ